MTGNTTEKERKERHVYINEQTTSNRTTENEYYYNTETVLYQKGRENAQNRQRKKPQKQIGVAAVLTWSDTQGRQNDEISM